MYDEVLKNLGEKKITKGKLHQMVEHNFELLPVLVKGMSSQKVSIRYGLGKVLIDLSEKYPEKVYPHIDSFIDLLDSKYHYSRHTQSLITFLKSIPVSLEMNI
ncbi:MAG: hypothetical protein KGD70_15155 [Candidatus Lokiarchaeota archaeon]|nr:hypothetical protein [Candidatus Lokiarchaeota archaeon]